MNVLKHIPSWIRNKYLLTVLAVTVWMFFFDPRDIGYTLAQRSRLRELQKNELRQVARIADTQKELGLLKTNAQTIEKYARENYMMKKSNEDLFIISSPAEAK